MTTLERVHSTIETWRNTQAGMRWYISFDLQGRETTKTVNGYRTFTITTFERQVNQERAATPEQDLFRNGGFVLVRGSSDTKEDELGSPNAITDADITDAVLQVIGGSETIEAVMEGIDSPFTMNRYLEQLVVEDAPKEAIEYVKKLLEEKEPQPNFRRPVLTKPDEVPDEKE
jgi:hypothetical protein